MEPHSVLWYYLWAAPHLLQVPLAVFMVRRKLQGEFPWFLTYTIYQIISNTTLFILNHLPAVSGRTYHVAINADDLVSIVLRFAVIYEVFWVVLRPYAALQRIASLLIRAALVILLLVDIIVAAFGPVPDYTTNLIRLSTSVNRAGSMVQCGLLLFLFLFSSYFRISWRSFGFGVSCGLGLYMAVQLIVTALSSLAYIPASDYIEMASYHVSVLLWLAYALAPQRVPVEIKNVPQHQLASWNVELERLLQR
jgi:hypothetical protein